MAGLTRERGRPASRPGASHLEENADYFLARPRFFFAGRAIRKSSFFLPALISRASQPAVPPLPLHVSPVFGCRYFGATLVPLIEPARLLVTPSPPPICASCA